MRGLITVWTICVLLSGCGDPLAGIDRLSDVEMGNSASSEGVSVAASEAFADTAPSTPLESKPGFWARLVQGGDTSADKEAPVIDATLTPENENVAATPQPQKSGWSLFAGKPRIQDKISVKAAYGAPMQFGDVARVCEARSKPLGRKIETSGRGGYALYDSNPDSIAPRSFYLTGFADRCPRQFTAALAVLGAPSMHEQIRYGLPRDIHPYSSTDRAYERVKARICNVGRRKPCGAAIRQMDRSTVFVSVYERFEDNARWADILVHDSVVIARAIKTAPD